MGEGSSRTSGPTKGKTQIHQQRTTDTSDLFLSVDVSGQRARKDFPGVRDLVLDCIGDYRFLGQKEFQEFVRWWTTERRKILVGVKVDRLGKNSQSLLRATSPVLFRV